MDKIKLVIWDLDETFWKGTLSEEGIQLISSNIEVVKTLTNRGIINSIVSKNTYTDAQEQLKKAGIWDYFVFPKIEWDSKGTLIKQVINQCQLREENVLFIDDNHINLEEASFHNPKLHTATPNFIPEILTHPAFIGKDDSSHSRLEQYKVLEQKSAAQKDFGDNIEFLRTCNIVVQEIVGDEVINHLDRAYELLERTNQLNYTKIRSSKSELIELINNPVYSTSLIKVHDTFGDYGIAGIYSHNTSTHTLLHFTFSCRILNLGIPQYLFSKLNKPAINIIPDVAEPIQYKRNVDWINWTNSNKAQTHKSNSSRNNLKVLLKGGCDLSQLTFYLQNKPFLIKEETNYVADNNFAIHQEHTQTLLNTVSLNQSVKEEITESKHIPFIDSNYFNTEVFKLDFDVFVYSLLMDYSQDLYQHKDHKYLIPFGSYNLSWDNEADHDQILADLKNRNLEFERESLQKFSAEFLNHGPISNENLIHNLNQIRERIPLHIPIILINGVEVESPHPAEYDLHFRHAELNASIDQYIMKSENVFLLDMRNIVTDQNQLTNNIRHYRRSVYQKMSVELVQLLNDIYDEKFPTDISTTTKWKDSTYEYVSPFIQLLKKLKRKIPI
jgi:FkbH-like protein